MQYKYDSKDKWLENGNLGDCIQNIAAEEIYHRAGIKPEDLLLINRDDLPEYDGPAAKLVMQGWFGNTSGTFPLPWSEKITPIFLGFHISENNNSREMFLEKKIQANFANLTSIGCRDRNTMRFLQGFGLDAYFSSCLTLTFDEREKEPENGKIFVVDLQPKTMQKLPEKIRKIADFSITHLYKFPKYPITAKDAAEFEDAARKILQRYKDEAKLVITSRIHVAMPCIAMGIPVVFISDHVSDSRFDVLSGIIPVYSYKDMKYVKWNPKAPKITKLKTAIINNAIAQITNTNTQEARKALFKITKKMYPIRYKPLYAIIFQQIFRK